MVSPTTNSTNATNSELFSKIDRFEKIKRLSKINGDTNNLKHITYFDKINKFEQIKTYNDYIALYNKTWYDWMVPVSELLPKICNVVNEVIKDGAALDKQTNLSDIDFKAKILKILDLTEAQIKDVKNVSALGTSVKNLKEDVKENKQKFEEGVKNSDFNEKIKDLALQSYVEKIEKTFNNKFSGQAEKNTDIDTRFKKHLEYIEACETLLKRYQDAAKTGDGNLKKEFTTKIKACESKIKENETKYSETNRILEKHEIQINANQKFCDSKFQDFDIHKSLVSKHNDSITELKQGQAGFHEKINHQGKKIEDLNDFYHKITPELVTLQIDLNRIVEEAKKESQNALENVNQSKEEVKKIENRLSTMMELVDQINQLKESIENLRLNHSSEIDVLKTLTDELVSSLINQKESFKLIIDDLRSEHLSKINDLNNEVSVQRLKIEHLEKVATQVKQQELSINELREVNAKQNIVIKEMSLKQKEYEKFISIFKNLFHNFFETSVVSDVNEIGTAIINIEQSQPPMSILHSMERSEMIHNEMMSIMDSTPIENQGPESKEVI